MAEKKKAAASKPKRAASKKTSSTAAASSRAAKPPAKKSAAKKVVAGVAAATGTVGTPLSIILKGASNVPPPGPGLMQMEAYDPAYLKVLQCGWYPPGELVRDAAAFRVIFMPLQAGSTEVQFTIQPRAINPLFQQETFSVTIKS